MKVIKQGAEYKIYGDESFVVSDKIPAGMYGVSFDPRSGFSLIKKENPCYGELIYGKYKNKILKVVNGYRNSQRNFGIGLTGDKGLGKTMFARRLAFYFIREGYPVIAIDEKIPGIADFINSIDQDVVVIFDEYEKTHPENFEDGHERNTEILTLLDGLAKSHKMFVLIFNDSNEISRYLLNRPGRLYYMFEFDSPDAECIEEYFRDNLTDPYKFDLKAVSKFISVGKVNFDSLKAITTELNAGYTLEETLTDLNVKVTTHSWYYIELETSDGKTFINKLLINPFDLDERLEVFYLKDSCESDYKVKGRFLEGSSFEYDPVDGYTLAPENFKVDAIMNEWRKHVEDVKVTSIIAYVTDNVEEPDYKLLKRFMNKNS